MSDNGNKKTRQQKDVIFMNQNSPLKRYATTVYKAAHYNTDPCLCLEPRGLGLLLQSAHRVTTFSHRQASARPQCSCPCHNQHQEVGLWQRVVMDTASRPSLAATVYTGAPKSKPQTFVHIFSKILKIGQYSIGSTDRFLFCGKYL